MTVIYFHGQKLEKKKQKQIPEEYQIFKVLQSLYLWDQRERVKHIIPPTKKVGIGKLETNIKTPLSNLSLNEGHFSPHLFILSFIQWSLVKWLLSAGETRQKNRGGINWETGTDIYTLLYIK